MWKLLQSRKSALASISLVFAVALPAHAQNLVQNASFDAGDDFWTIVLPALSEVDNSTGSDAPPSMKVSAPGPSSPLAQVYSTCIVVDESVNYDLIVDILHESGASEARVSAYTGHCLSFIGSAITVTGSGAGWQTQSSTNVTLPAGTGSVTVVLQTSSFPSEANFDRVRFGPTGTTPVTLQSFDID